MTQQTWGAPPQQQFQQQGFPAQQPQAPVGYYPPQQPQQQAPAQQGPGRIETGDSFDDFFGGAGEKIPGFDFGATQNGGEKMIGAQIMGEITEMARMQQRDFATGNPLFFDNGDPRMQVAITLQTDLRNWQGVKPKLIPIDDATGQPKAPHLDTGERRIYVKGDMVRAVNQACTRAGGQKPRVGGKIAVIVKGFEPTNKGNDKVLYDAQYVPAPEKVATDSFFEQAQQQAPQQGFGGPVPGFQGQPNAQGQFPPAQLAQQPQTAPVMSTATGQPVIHQQQIPAAQQAPQFDQGGQLPPGVGQVQNNTGQPEQIHQAPPQQVYPSTLGNGQPPAAPPEWATPPQPVSPAGYDAPPF